MSALERTLGYSFSDRSLLARALTHASAQTSTARAGMAGRKAGEPPKRGGGDSGIATGDYERLEFLGDRVLGLVMAELLYLAFPDASEGAIARRFNRLVRRETCSEVARAIDLGRHLVLGEGEAESGGRNKATILADACEAVLGAVFLDGGYDQARALIRRLWEPHVAAVAHIRADAKSALQEWAQGRGLPLPTYAEVAREGPDHAPHFTTEVRIEGLEPARGSGASKRAAEQAAAQALLEREGVWERASAHG